MDKERHLPGETISISFELANLSDKKLYLLNVGVRCEWMVHNGNNRYWYSQKVDDILNSSERKTVSLLIPIPRNIKLGTYEMTFGFEGQYLPVVGYQDQLLSPRWSLPINIEIKYPFNGEEIFLSHSVRDNHLVRNLKDSLESYGFAVVLGEDVDQPGVYLEHKFKNLIENSTIFIALLTEPAIRSDWVRNEINYAYSSEKPLILLKEKNLHIDGAKFQWNEFDRDAPTQELLSVVMNAIGKVKKYKELLSPETQKILAIALFSFILGWLVSKS